MISHLGADQEGYFSRRQQEKELNRSREYAEMQVSREAVARASHFAGVRQRARVVRRALQRPSD